MRDTILKTIRRYNMLEAGDNVTVGVSGGADSVCLLHFLSTIRGEYDINIKAVHINHCIRGQEALRDENFVKELCERLDIELSVVQVDVPSLAIVLGKGIEECGREARYDIFASTKANKTAVAHTASDNLETVIFNLARGTALTGICGIPPVRGNIIRPLIEITREEVESYCRHYSLSFVTDSSNLSDDYARNKIRHNVVPILKSLNPSLEHSISRFCLSARDDDKLLDHLAERALTESRCTGGYERENLSALPISVKRRAIAFMLDKAEVDFDATIIELCVGAVDNTGKVEVKKSTYFAAERNLVRISERHGAAQPWEISADIEKNITPYGAYELTPWCLKNTGSINRNNSFDLDKVDLESLVFRSRKEGDTFSDPARKVTKSLKKLFIEDKIPQDDRLSVPVLADKNGVIWVKGYRVDKRYAVTDNTTWVIQIEES